MNLRDDARVESFAPFVISEMDYNAKRQNQARRCFDNPFDSRLKFSNK